MVQTRAYGTWESPISAADTVGGIVDFGQIAADGDNLYWLEGRPSEGGRQVLVRRDGSGQIDDLTAPPIYVRTQVHEYGGGAFTVGNGRVAYSELLGPTALSPGRGADHTRALASRVHCGMPTGGSSPMGASSVSGRATVTARR